MGLLQAILPHPLCQPNVLQEQRRNQTGHACSLLVIHHPAMIVERVIAGVLQVTAATLQAMVADQAIAVERRQIAHQGRPRNLTEHVWKAAPPLLLTATPIRAGVLSSTQATQRHLQHRPMVIVQMAVTDLQMIIFQFGSN